MARKQVSSGEETSVQRGIPAVEVLRHNPQKPQSSDGEFAEHQLVEEALFASPAEQGDQGVARLVPPLPAARELAELGLDGAGDLVCRHAQSPQPVGGAGHGSRVLRAWYRQRFAQPVSLLLVRPGRA